MKNILSVLLLAISSIIIAQHNIIPEPVSYQANGKSLVIEDKISINNTIMENQLTVNDFSAYLVKIGYKVEFTINQQATINIKNTEDKDLPEEGYLLEITSFGVDILCNSNKGLFNAFQTLKQLLPLEAKATNIAGCIINDYPRFPWRGLMLDVSRHFFTLEEIKQYLDVMSSYKFNVFHWHLTDDNGWRVEIKSLPELTSKGAWRTERHGQFNHRAKPKLGEPTPYGGFYTQEQIKDIVKYAATRNITIIPEIDVPGHSMAVLAAYPELSTLKEKKMVSPGHKFAVWPGDGTFKMLEENTLDPSNEKVYEFIDKVFTEVAELFPGQYIHMGGDECYKGYWEQSPTVQKFMKDQKIKDAHELQSYFVGRVQKIINSKGKKMIGWDEIIEGGLTKGATVMSWQGMKGGIHAAKAGHEVVMSPTTYAYLDYQQGDLSVENSIYANLSLEKSYTFEPVPNGVDSSLILGGQANVWTEAIPTMPFAFYMTYPRAFAIAETVWSPSSKKNWNNFMNKTEVHFLRFDTLGLNVCKAVYEPIIKVYKENGKVMCKLENNVPGTKIYYSINNTYPVHFDTPYTKPFEVPAGKLKLRTQTYKNGKAVGRELIITRKDLVKRIKK